ncbi:hypothetical protein IKE71_00305 [Candidatus Saccharibacteria bacterium]|nr:hypothetical protein [Candidatus Saccharibacteria bacterium]
MIVLKDIVREPIASPRPVKLDFRIKFESRKEIPYRDLEYEKSFRIACDASYRPLEHVKRMGW